MTTIAFSSVNIQTSTSSVPSIPPWFGEITLLVRHLQHQGVLAAIEEQVRFARRRFGRYEVNGRWKRFTSGSNPGLILSWRSLDATVCLPVRR
jgi:hypothetical protein